MPTLQFKGKNIIWNHHMAVPFHTLDEVPKLHYKPEKADGNMIIEGDNLIALKALLPQFAGKVKCIYIDPPYNTGTETGTWIYNDNVNSPLLKEWIGREVGSDDLTRDDKWLCMMTPRLKLLYELLSDDGVIFISIDDYQFHNLRLLTEEIFGQENFLAVFVWRRRASSAMTDNMISRDHEYVICYRKPQFVEFNGIPKEYINYSNPDNDPNGEWTAGDLTVGMTKEQRPNQYYDLKDPSTGKKFKANPKRVWAFIPESMEKEIKAGRIIFPEKEAGKPMLKRYKNNLKSEVNPISTWIKSLNGTQTNIDVSELSTGLNSEGTKEIQELFDEKVFDYPKPRSLIKALINQICSGNSIILDSFAGSGTTMHAVMELNKEDDGNRKCILVQMTENTEQEPNKNICKDITRERIKRAIDKYGYDSGFKYYRVGIPLDAESMLAGDLPAYKQFAKYVYYLCTGENLAEDAKINEEKYFVGIYGKQVIYLIYKQDYDTLTRLAFNLTIAEQIKTEQPGKRRIVYAPACFLDEEYLEDNQFDYVGIPYNLFQRNI